MEVNSVTSQQIDTKEQPLLEQDAIRKRSRKRNITIFVVVSILNVALLALLWTQLLTPAQNQVSGPLTYSSGTGDVNSAVIGKPMPDFTLKTLDGNSTLHLASLKGKPIILNFWASWCTGCVQEASYLGKIQSQLHAQGITFIGIDGQERASDALSFLQKNNLSYFNVQDTTNATTAISYGSTGFPETVFINRRGIIVAKWAGPLNDAGLKTELAKMKL